jgi:TetR/AcrR family tetracycline transcriptional repressor
VDPLALYTYVSDKNELLSAMCDHVLAEAGQVLPDEPGDPRQELTAFFTAMYRLLVEYTDLTRFVRPTIEGMDLGLAERVYRMLTDLGVPQARIGEAQLALAELTYGSAIFANARMPSTDRLSVGPDYPLLSTVLRRFDELRADAEGHFVRTFGLLLDALVRETSDDRPHQRRRR